ncbi:MAG: GNAT family N-acetyltransferase [Candidatus Heimdallarchaeota archaeon]|nr:GNAT family N-acetyltransferase [Candidatus Heimdallarchaeota archaeon]
MSLLPEGYSIRKLEIEDVKDVIEIYQTITGENSPEASELEARMDYGDSMLCLGIEYRAKIVGFIFGESRRGEYGETEPIGWIGLLGIDPNHRNKELGRQLGSELLEQFKGIGIRKIRTTVTNTNTSLLKFFMNIGLKPASWTVLEYQTY